MEGDWGEGIWKRGMGHWGGTILWSKWVDVGAKDV